MLADQEIKSSVSSTDPKLNDNEKQELLCQISGWQIKSDSHEYLVKRFEFSNFVQAQAFANKVAELAEEANHHPDICFGWGYAEIRWWTHTINGLHLNDFIMVARIDCIQS